MYMAVKKPVKKRYKKKKRVKLRALIKVLAVIFACLILAACAVFFIPKLINGFSGKIRYIAGTDSSVDLYYYDEYDDHLLISSETIVRGSEVTMTKKTYEQNGQTYRLIKYGGEEYYIVEGHLAESLDELVLETEKWVRTGVTVYTDAESAQIESFIAKGSLVNITGYDEVMEDGAVNMYEIEYEGVTGWVYAKYLTGSEEEALAQYEAVYANHEGRAYSYELYGGDVSDLDWYPYEKASFEDNELLAEDASVIYLNMAALLDIDSYLELAAENGVNGVVVDIKDGCLVTSFDTAAALSPTSNENAYMDEETFAEAMAKISEAGLYIIARIVTFSDTYYAEDNPDDCIETSVTTTAWPSAYSRNVWYYNVSLALETAQKYGVNEIMFDYVRFPDSSYSMSLDEDTDFKNSYDETMAQALQNFLFYACDVLHRSEVYVSVCVEAESVNKYVLAYGQYWPAFSNIADVICPWALVDSIGLADSYWSDEYTTLYNWAERALARQSEVETPAVCRAWITGYDVPYWSPYIECTSDYVENMIRGLYDRGIEGGFIIYNEEANISAYSQIAPALSVSY